MQGYSSTGLAVLCCADATSATLSRQASIASCHRQQGTSLWRCASITLIPPLLAPCPQLPHFNPELCANSKAAGVEHIFDLLEMEDEQRRELLGMSDRQLEEVARYCSR